MLRKCILVLSNTFYNAFFECTAQLVAVSDEVATRIQTYQQRLFVDGDHVNYHFNSDGELIFGLTDPDDGTFVDELLVNLSVDVKSIDHDVFINDLPDELECLHGFFVTQGINSIVTVYFSPKQS